MEELGGEADVFDIGVDADRSTSSRPAQRNAGASRPLPRWAFAAFALLVGWLLGSLLSSGTETAAAEDPAVAPIPASPSAEQATAVVELADPTPPLNELPLRSGASPTGSFDTSDFTNPDTIVSPDTDLITNEPEDDAVVVMVNAPLRGVPIPADITVIEGDIATKIDIDQQISGAIEGSLRQTERRMLVVDDAVVFMALDAVMTFDLGDTPQPVQLATAIYLLKGSSPGRAWAVTSGSQSVIDIDLRNRRAQATYALTDVGSPLASFDGGLVIAPTDIAAHGRVALWSPAQGITAIPAIYDDADFIGAAGDTLVFFRRGGLATYNVVTGWNWQTPIDLPASIHRRSLVSPDARSLAVTVQGTVTQLPVVQVIDIETGEQIDWFEAAFAWQLRWVSETELLFLNPANDGVQVMLRDTARGTTRQLTDLVGPNFWVALAR